MPTDFETCPTDVARAPVQRLWERLTNPSLFEWLEVRSIDVPARDLRVGDRLVFAASLGLRVSWTVLALDPPHRIALEIGLPFGMANHQVISVSPIDENRCRVTFN